MDYISEKFPKTADKAIEILLSGLSFQEKTKIANMSVTELAKFHSHYGIYIRTRFRIPGNDPLIESCRLISGLPKISPEQASYIILKMLYNEINKTNVLRIVK